MKKNILIVILFFIFHTLYSQEIGVPFRIGNKFGVSDNNGKMLIPAKYDIVEPKTYNSYNYFTAYTLDGNYILSTLIYNNKILLADKAYSSYYINNGLVTAIEYKILKKPSYHSNDDHSEHEHLYDLKGNEIFKADFKAISIIDDIDEKNKINTFLIYTHDLNDYESLYLYDKKLKKITKTFIDNAKPINARFNYQDNYRDRTITNIYLDKNGVGKKMILKVQNNSIVVDSETTINFPSEKRQMEGRNYDDVPVVPYPEKPSIPLSSEEEKTILTVRKIEQKRGFYYLPKKIEELKIYNFNLKKDEQFVVSKNNKQGLYTVYNNSYIIPVMYDEIIFADFEGRNGGYVLRNGTKYGVFIYDHPNNKIIEPVFDKIPLLVNFNYFGERKPLFKLYDEEGKLFCYANEKGKLYYQP